jgi:hypothetical protein
MRFASVPCAYLRRSALRYVDRTEVHLYLLNFAIANDEEEMIVIGIGLSALHPGVCFGLDCNPSASALKPLA